MNFYFTTQECNKLSNQDKYLGTQLWALTEGAGTWTPEQAALEIEKGFAPAVAAFADAGLIEYGGASSTTTNSVFLYHVFDTIELVQSANDAVEAYVTSHKDLSTVLEKVVFIRGQEEVDYTCAAGNLPA
jgi:hypothetical protein